jgi:hypothetical protein
VARFVVGGPHPRSAFVLLGEFKGNRGLSKALVVLFTETPVPFASMVSTVSGCGVAWWGGRGGALPAGCLPCARAAGLVCVGPPLREGRSCAVEPSFLVRSPPRQRGMRRTRLARRHCVPAAAQSHSVASRGAPQLMAVPAPLFVLLRGFSGEVMVPFLQGWNEVRAARSAH